MSRKGGAWTEGVVEVRRAGAPEGHHTVPTPWKVTEIEDLAFWRCHQVVLVGCGFCVFKFCILWTCASSCIHRSLCVHLLTTIAGRPDLEGRQGQQRSHKFKQISACKFNPFWWMQKNNFMVLMHL